MRFYLSFLLLSLAALTTQAFLWDRTSRASRPQDCRPLDLTLLLDRSGSIQFHSERNWQIVKAFCNNIVDFLASKHEVGINSYVAAITFNKKARVNFDFMNLNNPQSIKDRVNRLPNPTSQGRTNINDAMNRALGLSHDGRNPRKVVLIITDGRSTEELNQVQATAKRLRGDGNLVIAIAIKTQDFDLAELEGIVSNKNTLLFDLNSYMDLQMTKTFNSILSSLCNPPPPTCRPLDLTLLLDRSGSIQFHSQKNWRILKSFCNEIVDFLASKAQGGIDSYMAAISFNKKAKVEFGFMNVNNPQSIKDRLNRMPGPTADGKTNINDAMNRAYGLSHGGRNPRKLILLITDGRSTEEVNQVQATAKKLRDDNTPIIAIAIRTQDFNLGELQGIVAGNKIFNLRSYMELQLARHLNAILSSLCNL